MKRSRSVRPLFLMFSVLFLLTVIVYLPFTRILAASNSSATVIQSAKAVNFKNAHNLKLKYVGSPDLVSALESGRAVPTALAAADFEGDGAPDVVVGYSLEDGGVLAILRGNQAAYAPKDRTLYQKAMLGKPPSTFLPNAKVLAVPGSPDLLVAGDFDGSGHKDILVGARGGGLYLLRGDGHANFGAPQAVSLPGKVTALAVNGSGQLAVGVAGGSVPELLVFNTPSSKFPNPRSFALPGPANSVEWGALGKDGAMDIAAATGASIFVIYDALDVQAQTETIRVSFNVTALALGDFIWDREHRTEIAVLADNGTIHILQHGTLDTRPLTPAEISAPATQATGLQNPTSIGPWTVAKQLSYVATNVPSRLSQTAFRSPRLLGAPTSDLMVLDSHLNILDTGASANPRAVVSFSGSPVAAYALPQKLNAERDIVVLINSQTAPTLLTAGSDPTCTVNTTTDEDNLKACTTSVPACTTETGGTLSLREAICEANTSGGSVTIDVDAGTYNLSLNTGGETGELQAGTTSGAIISIVGEGTPANTIINQTTGSNRVLNQDPVAVGNVQLSISNVTLSGGSPASGNGGGILAGSTSGDTLTLSNVVISGNSTAATGNGGGVFFASASGTTPLTITNSAFTNNTASGGEGGGLSASLAMGTSASITGATFTGNSATATGSGGGIFGSGSITVSNSRLVGNTAGASAGAGYDQSSGTGNVIDNWWGCNGGPGTSGCDTVAATAPATATFSPWLVLSLSANPTSIPITTTSTLTADLTHDSNGGTGFSVPDGTPATFGSPTLGTISNATNFTGGQATATFTAGGATGTGGASVTVDNETLSTSITITNVLMPTVTVVPTPSTITFGQSSTINVTVSGSGPTPTGTVAVSDGIGDSCTITLSSGSGSCVVTPSSAQTLMVTAIYSGDSNYSSSTGTGSLIVNRATPVIAWGTPAPITYGTALSATQLDASANVPGAFLYTPAAGTVLGAGSQALSVSFTPTDTTDYTTATAAVTLIVNKAAPTVTFSGAPASAVYLSTFTVASSTNASTTATITATGACSVSGNIVTMTSGTGTCNLVANWAADNNYFAASASQSTAAVKAASTTTITSNAPNPSAPGQAVAVSFQVAGNGSPTGIVTVAASTNESCGAQLSAGGGSCSLTFVTVGPRSLTATYSGDVNFLGSVSAGVTQIVNGPLASLSPASVNFGNVQLGSWEVRAVTLSNVGNASMSVGTVQISGGNDKGDFIAFSICPATLTAGRSCEIAIVFWAHGDNYSPTATLYVNDNALGSPQTVPLSATVIRP